MKQAVGRRFLKLSWFIFVFVIGLELALRIGGGLFINPSHLTHGFPVFIDLRAGIFMRADLKPDLTAPLISGQTKFVATEQGVIPARINVQGFRGEDFELRKPPGMVRLVTLGGSSTFGYGSRDDETYPKQLEEILLSRCSGSPAFQVYNFGLPYRSTPHIVRILREKVISYKPDLVMLYAGVNNVANVSENPVWSWLRERVLLVQYLHVPVRDQWRSFDRSDLELVTEQDTARYMRDVVQMKEDAGEIGARFLPISQQAQSGIFSPQIRTQYSYQKEFEVLSEKLGHSSIGTWEFRFVRHHALMESLRNWAEESGSDFLDFIPIMDRSRDHLISWVHLDRSGNRMLAMAIAEWVVQHYPCNLPAPSGEPVVDAGPVR